MAKKFAEQRWVIVNVREHPRLYVGQYLTRNDGIAYRVWNTSGPSAYGDKPLSQFPEGQHNRLSLRQGAIWEKLRKQGDRCVRATITWEIP